MNDITLPRLLLPELEKRLASMPVVVVSGARQTGKSTLVRRLLKSDRRWITLDDFESLSEIRGDPTIVTHAREDLTIDEVQRAPDLLLDIKRSIDDNRTSGRFLLTGSANLLLMKGVSETLAGRAAYLTLRPMTRSEQLGHGVCGIWDALFTRNSDEWVDVLQKRDRGRESWVDLARRGGFPTPAVHMKRDEERTIWFDGYTRTYLERDLLQLSNVSDLSDFRRLMRAASLRLGQILNQTDLGRDIGLSQSTVHRYLNLLEVSCLLVRLPAYSINRTKRLMKSPRLFWGDTGLALYLAGNPAPKGFHLENLILNDLLAWADTSSMHREVHYWRTVQGEEVDFVVETDNGLLPVEVKASAHVGLSDTRGIRLFRKEYPESLPGLLLYNGDDIQWVAPDVLALPWWQVI